MPLSRQTSRMVWPSRPVSVRPSISMEKLGATCGRCGLCVVSSRSAIASTASSRSAGSVSVIGRGTPGIRRGLRLGRWSSVATAATRMGWQTPAGQVPRTMWSSNSCAKYRIPDTQRVDRRALETAQRTVADVVGRGWPRAPRRWVARGRCRTPAPSSASRRVPMRQGIVLPHASSLSNRVSSAARSTMQVVSSMTSTVPEPRMAPAASSSAWPSGRVERVRRQEPAGGTAHEHRLERAGRAAARLVDDVPQGRAHGHLGDARLRATAPLSCTSVVPGSSVAPIAA